MSTMGAHMQMLKPNHHTKAHRHTGNVMYNCAGGEGYSIIGGKFLNGKSTISSACHHGYGMNT